MYDYLQVINYKLFDHDTVFLSTEDTSFYYGAYYRMQDRVYYFERRYVTRIILHFGASPR